MNEYQSKRGSLIFVSRPVKENENTLNQTERIAHSAGAVEYTDCTSAEGYDPPPLNEFPDYDTDGEVPVMLRLWEMWSTPSLPSLPGPLLPGVVVPNMTLSTG